jgi:hypothetical protein
MKKNEPTQSNRKPTGQPEHETNKVGYGDRKLEGPNRPAE